MNFNSRLLNLENENSFSKVIQKISEYKKKNASIEVVSLGVGDVSRPIVPDVIDAMHGAVDDLGNMDTFKGYGAYFGYDFLKNVILSNEYKDFYFSNDEIYISNGTKTDTSAILELFEDDVKICLMDPMYPIYKDAGIVLGKNIKLLVGDIENNFIPTIPEEKFDVIYLCSPNNPVGNAYDKEELKKWIEYALANESVILYDNVYSAFITSSNVPKSIYELDNAKKVAIEFRSFSKVASFTGVRCSYYIIPDELSNIKINKFWKMRTMNKFNGADYIAQRGAMATYLPKAQEAIKNNIEYYMKNARVLKNAFEKFGFKVWGGIDSPFLWINIKNEDSSWNFFDKLLNKFGIVIIPGCIFGKHGEGYARLSAFASIENINIAIKRLKEYYEK